MKKEGAKAANSITDSFKRSGEKMKRIGMGMTAGITAPLAGAGAMAVKTAADYEQLQIQLNTLVGSAEKGSEVFEQLKRFSAETPFQVKDIIRANNTLIGMGQSAEQAFDMIQMMGDVSSATGANMKELAVTIGQASAEGRLMTRDIRELVNRGVPATKLLADSMGVAKSEIFDLAEQGKISFDVLQQALRDATQEGGIFAGATEKAVDTIAGAWSTMKDNVTFALAEVGNVIVNTLDLKQLTKDITVNIQTITKRFSELSDDTKTEILQTAGLFMAGGPLLIGLGQAAVAISAFSKLVRTRFFLITAAAAGMAAVVEQQGQLWSKVFGDREKDVDNFTTSARKGLGKLIGPILDFSEEAIGAGDALDRFRDLLSNLGGADEANKVLSNTQKTLSFINGDVTALNSNLSELASRSSKSAKQTQKSFKSFDIGTAGIDNADSKIGMMEQSSKQLNNTLSGVPKKLGQFQGGASSLKVALTPAATETERISQAAQTAGQSLGQMFDQAILHGKDFMGVVSNILKQLASKVFVQGVTALITGGSSLAAGSIGKAIFGGLFHGGGMVPGTGERMIRAKGGEMVLTQSQQRALSMGGGGGGTSINPKAIGSEIAKQLDRKMSRLGPKEVFVMSQDGRRYK